MKDNLESATVDRDKHATTACYATNSLAASHKISFEADVLILYGWHSFPQGVYKKLVSGWIQGMETFADPTTVC